MDIRVYTTGNILEFVNSDQFSRLKSIPITRHRASSYAHNPRSDSSDKILFVAFENEEIIGYLGALPEKIFYQEEWRRMTWLSCFWIDPQFRGKNISKQLFDMAMKEWDKTAMITNMKPGTLKIYERTGYFQDPVTRIGIRGYLRFNLSEILPPKGGVFAKIKPVFQAIDFVFNIFNAIRLVFYPGYKIDNDIHYEYVEEISPEAGELIDKCNQSYLIRRGKQELEWVKNYPWVLEQEENADNRRYYFSSVSKRFFYQQVEFHDENGNVVAYLMLSILAQQDAVHPAVACNVDNVAAVTQPANIRQDNRHTLIQGHGRAVEPACGDAFDVAAVLETGILGGGTQIDRMTTRRTSGTL